MKTRKTQLTMTVVFTALLGSTSAWALSPGGGGEDPFEDYSEAGTHDVVSEAAGSECTVFRPETLSGEHPVILWGNGTGASVAIYRRGLEHWASWGYVVVAANTSNSGTGAEMIDCLNTVGESELASSLDLTRIGTSGHSQGGGGALMAGRDSRVTATAPFQPYIQGLGHDTSSQDEQSGPMLLLSGSTDFLAGPATNQQPVFDRANVPVFWANSQGTSHFEPLGDFGLYRGMATAWWEYQLRDDDNATNLFTGPCLGCDLEGWVIERQGL